MSNPFQGDPAIQVTKQGASMKFIDGQPVMDQGYENAVMFSLFTDEGWAGNSLFVTNEEKIGSKFEQTNKLPITLSNLEKRRKVTVQALQWLIDNKSFKSIDVTVTNPSSKRIIYLIQITPPNGENVNLTLSNFGANWQLQVSNPAHERF